MLIENFKLISHLSILRENVNTITLPIYVFYKIYFYLLNILKVNNFHSHNDSPQL